VRLNYREAFIQTLQGRPSPAIALTTLALLVLAGVASVIGRSLGYILGVGIVEQNSLIRVLHHLIHQVNEHYIRINIILGMSGLPPKYLVSEMTDERSKSNASN